MSNVTMNDELPGFDEPLALLRACHKNILAHCDRLEALLAHIDEQGIDDEARKAARDIVHYFSGSTLLHHRDEEEDLFPRLNRQSLRIAELIQDLKQEHSKLDQLWENMVSELKPLPDQHFSDGFLQATRDFCTLSRQHVNRENMEFLPLAASSLSQLDLDEIGASMAARRGVRI
jgi:hemerythrin-like domain-containing protein